MHWPSYIEEWFHYQFTQTNPSEIMIDTFEDWKQKNAKLLEVEKDEYSFRLPHKQMDQVWN